MNFRDSTAIRPLLLEEPDFDLRYQEYFSASPLTVWYGTRLEIESL
jgi:hypothetical protein